MHILFATAEIAPFTPETKVSITARRWSAALATYRPPRRPDELPAPNPIKNVTIITPLYGFIDKDTWALARRLTTLTVPLDGKPQEVALYEGRTADRVRVFFLEHRLFERKFIYGPPGRKPYKENARKFAFFDRCVVEFCRKAPVPIDVVHCHDWPTGLVPVYIQELLDDHPELEDVLTCFSVYDLTEQGTFEAADFQGLGLSDDLMAEDALAQSGALNFTKGGVLFGDVVTTPSPTFTDEILTEPAGAGLSGVFEYRGEDLFGVLEGVQYDRFDPRTDGFIPVRYDLEHLNGKRRNKSELQHIFGLPLQPLVPLFGYLGPLTAAAGVDRLVDALGVYLEDDAPVHFIAMGEGDDAIKQQLVELRDRFPRRVGLHFGEDEALLHHALAGLDVFVAPARQAPFEELPIWAMRYATVIVAPDSGCFGDVVEEWGEGGQTDPLRGGGFLFDATGGGLGSALGRALAAYRNPRRWRPIMESCIRADFSWQQTADATVALYRELLG